MEGREARIIDGPASPKILSGTHSKRADRFPSFVKGLGHLGGRSPSQGLIGSAKALPAPLPQNSKPAQGIRLQAGPEGCAVTMQRMHRWTSSAMRTLSYRQEPRRKAVHSVAEGQCSPCMRWRDGENRSGVEGWTREALPRLDDAPSCVPLELRMECGVDQYWISREHVGPFLRAAGSTGSNGSRRETPCDDGAILTTVAAHRRVLNGCMLRIRQTTCPKQLATAAHFSIFRFPLSLFCILHASQRRMVQAVSPHHPIRLGRGQSIGAPRRRRVVKKSIFSAPRLRGRHSHHRRAGSGG